MKVHFLLFTMSSLSNSLGFYASMIKDALEKTISEGKVCLSADYNYFPPYFIVISLACDFLLEFTRQYVSTRNINFSIFLLHYSCTFFIYSHKLNNKPINLLDFVNAVQQQSLIEGNVNN